MKLTIEVFEVGALVTAEDGAAVEQAAYSNPLDALDAIRMTLGLPATPQAPTARPQAPVAPSPSPLNDEEAENEANAIIPPPATRRIGLTQPKKSLPPAGTRRGA